MLEPIIIDDETQILCGLHKLIDWNALGYTQPKCFSNPFTALEYLRRHRSPVVITDIRMPELTGLEVIKRIQAISKDTRIVVISSYSNFEYIQNALIAGVKNYILKPIHEDELTETLLRIRHEFAAAEYDLDGTSAIQERVFSLISKGQAYRLSAAENALLHRCSVTCSYQLMLISENLSKSKVLLQILLQAPAPSIQRSLIPFDDCTLAVLLHPQKSCGVRIVSSSALLRPDAPLILYTRQHRNFDLMYDRICAMKHRHAALRFLIPERRGLISISTERPTDLDAQQLALDKHISASFDALKEALFSLSRDALEKEFASLGSAVQKSCCTLLPDTIINAYCALLRNLNCVLEKQLRLKWTIPDDAPDAAGKPETLEMLTSASIEYLWHSLMRAQSLVTKGSGIVSTVELYIHLNYQKPLTLNSVASHFFFNPSYLSFLFSKNDLSFLSCLNDIRLMHGSALLRETDLTISAIAHATGFYSDKNFYKAFRKKYGCTPTQYRISG